jgi:hypothetical protein
LGVVVVLLGVTGLARAGDDACRARLKQMDTILAARRAAVRGWTRLVPRLEGFEIASVAAVKPLESAGIFVEMSESDLWLDLEAIPGADRASKLRELSARIEKLWNNYKLLHPKGPPPDRRIYVVFDKWVMVKDAVETIAVIGRDNVLIPIAAPEAWTPIVPRGPALDARLRSVRAEVDAVSAATKYFDYYKLIEHAMGTCKGSLASHDKSSEDEVRADLHARVIGLLTACGCRGANVDAVENVLLDEDGGLARPMQRLPLQLKAAGGKPLEADPEATVMSVLTSYAAQPGAGDRPITLRARAPVTKKR